MKKAAMSSILVVVVQLAVAVIAEAQQPKKVNRAQQRLRSLVFFHDTVQPIVSERG
jgi:hypothetical protein